MNIEAPDGKVIQFPDDMPQEQIQAAMGKMYPKPGIVGKIGHALGAGAEAVKRGWQGQPALQPVAGPEQQGIVEKVANVATALPEQFAQGALQTIQGIPQIPGQLATAASNIPAAIEKVVTDPLGAAKQVGKFAAGMVGPAGEAVVRGEVPSAGEVAKSVGGLYGGAEVGRVGGSLAKQAGTGIIKSGSEVLPIEQHAQTAARIREMPTELAPPPGAKAAAEATLAPSMGVVTPMPNFQAQIQSLLDRQALMAPTEQSQHMLTRLQGLKEFSDQGLTFDKLKVLQEELGKELKTPAEKRIGFAGSTKGYLDDSQIRSLMKSAYQDIEAHNPQLAEEWSGYRQIVKREKAVEEWSGEINQILGRTGDAYESAGKINALINKIEKQQRAAALPRGYAGRRWASAFTPEELSGYVTELEELKRQLPALPAGKGVPTGSSLTLPRMAVGGAVGAAAGSLLGHPAIGSALGTYAAAKVPRIVASLIQTDMGRKIVRKALQADPTVGPTFINATTAFLRAAEPQMPQTQTKGKGTDAYYKRTAEDVLGGVGNSPETSEVDDLSKLHKQVDRGKVPNVDKQLKSGKLGVPAIKQILQRSNEKNTNNLLKYVSPEDAMQMYHMASPEERQWIEPAVRARLEAMTRPPASPQMRQQAQQYLQMMVPGPVTPE